MCDIKSDTNILKEYVRDDKVKQNDVSTADNIKMPASEIHKCISSDEIKIEYEVIATKIKTEYSIKELFCEVCNEAYQDYCAKCGMLVHVLNAIPSNNTSDQGKSEIPRNVLEIRQINGHSGVFTLKAIPKDVIFGPFTGLNTSECAWTIKRGKFTVDDDKLNLLNWMQHINSAKSIWEQNLFVFQYEDNIYYRTTREIAVDEELFVYFGEEYRLNEDIEMVFIPVTEEDAKHVFACAVCCLGFNSRKCLLQHKTICPNGTNREMDDEVLAQCSFCKIFLVKQEYIKYHIKYCHERIARGGDALAMARKIYCRELVSEEDDEEEEYESKKNKIIHCKYCSKDLPSSNFTRHLGRHHGKEKEVQNILRYPQNSKERRRAITLLRNNTNFNLYLEGTIRPRRVLKKCDENRVYVPCEYCNGLYIKKYLKRHHGICIFKISKNVKKRRKDCSPHSRNRTVTAGTTDATSRVPKLNEEKQINSDVVVSQLDANSIESKSKRKPLDRKTENKSISANIYGNIVRCRESHANADDGNEDTNIANNSCDDISSKTADLNATVKSDSSETLRPNTRKKGKQFEASDKMEELKKKKDKIVHCKYCSKDLLSSNFTRHLRRNHANEKEVKNILRYPENSNERRRAITMLRNNTNFNLYLEGTIRPRRVVRKYDRNTNYVPCEYCKGLYIKQYLKRHQRICVFNQISNNVKKRRKDCSPHSRSRTVATSATNSATTVPKLNRKEQDTSNIPNPHIHTDSTESKSKRSIHDRKAKSKCTHLNASKNMGDRLESVAKVDDGNKDVNIANNSNDDDSSRTCDQSANVKARSLEISRLNTRQKGKQVDALSSDKKKEHKLKRNKIVHCKYCSKDLPSSNFTRHLRRNHAKEKEVENILRYPENSKERRQAITLLRNTTNFNLYLEGTIRPKRVLKKYDRNRIYSPCEYCKGLYSKKCLRRHIKMCAFNKIANNIVKKKKKKGLSALSHSQTLTTCASDTTNTVSQLNQKEQGINIKQTHETDATETQQQERSLTEFIDSSTSWNSAENEESECTSGFQIAISYERPYGKPLDIVEHLDAQNNISLENSSMNTVCKAEESKFTILQNVGLQPRNVEHENKETTAVSAEKNLNIQNVGVIGSSKKMVEISHRKSRTWDRKDRCVYCRRDCTHFSRHLFRNHEKEAFVKRILQLPTGDKQRKQMINLLRKEGNLTLLDENKIRPVQRARQNDEGLAEREEPTEFIPCPYCKGIYRLKSLRNHSKRCSYNPGDDGKCNIGSLGQNVLVFEAAPRKKFLDKLQLKNEIFSKMHADRASFNGKTDPVICQYAEEYLRKCKRPHINNAVSNKLRELGRLLIPLQDIYNLNTMLEVMATEHYDKVIHAAQIISGYDATSKTFKSPSLAMHMKTILMSACAAAETLLSKQDPVLSVANCAETLKTVNNFRLLVDQRWKFDMGSLALKDLNEKHEKKTQKSSITSDIIIFRKYVVNIAEDNIAVLKDNVNDQLAFKKLTEAALVLTMLLNPNRVGDVQSIKLDSYTQNTATLNQSECVESESEKLLSMHFKRVVTVGKDGETVTILFPKNVQTYIEVLISSREKNQLIPTDNPFLFAVIGSEDKWLDGSSVLRQYATCCGAENPETLTSSRRRKQIATVLQALNLNEMEKEQVATFVDHANKAHEDYCRPPQGVYLTSEIAKLLLMLDNGETGELQGKTLDEIDAHLESLTEEGIGGDLESINEETPAIDSNNKESLHCETENSGASCQSNQENTNFEVERDTKNKQKGDQLRGSWNKSQKTVMSNLDTSHLDTDGIESTPKRSILERKVKRESKYSNTSDNIGDCRESDAEADDGSEDFNISNCSDDDDSSTSSDQNSCSETSGSNTRKNGKQSDPSLSEKTKEHNQINEYKLVRCKFCLQDLVSKNFSRHLKRNHTKETEVADMLRHPRRSKERRRALILMRNSTNFELYLEGTIRPRRVLNSYNKNRVYYPCAYCKGLFVKEYLWRHASSCVVNNESDSAQPQRKDHLSLSQTFTACALDTTNIIAELNVTKQVFDSMKGDEVSFEAKKDLLIAHFGEFCLKKHRSGNLVHTCSNRMRGLSRLLIDYRSITNDDSVALKGLFRPENFDNVMRAAKNVLAYDPARKICRSLTTAILLKTSLRLVCDELVRLTEKRAKGFECKSDEERQDLVENVKRFRQRLESHWHVELPLLPQEHVLWKRKKSVVETSLEPSSECPDKNEIMSTEVEASGATEGDNGPSTSVHSVSIDMGSTSDHVVNDTEYNIAASEEHTPKRRRGWATEEVDIIKSHFGYFIETGTYPARKSVHEFLQFTKIDRTIPMVISKIQHLSKEVNVNSTTEGGDLSNLLSYVASTSDYTYTDAENTAVAQFMNSVEQSINEINNFGPKRRRGWSAEEIEAIRTHFGSFIETKTYPARQSVDEFLKSTNIDRTTPMIISKIQHLMRSQN